MPTGTRSIGRGGRRRSILVGVPPRGIELQEKGIIFRMRIDGGELVIDTGPGLNWVALNARWDCPSADLMVVFLSIILFIMTIFQLIPLWRWELNLIFIYNY